MSKSTPDYNGGNQLENFAIHRSWEDPKLLSYGDEYVCKGVKPRTP